MLSTPVVIVTGGARGIGLGIAECFAARKAKIVIADLDEGSAKEAARQVCQRGAESAVGIRETGAIDVYNTWNTGFCQNSAVAGH